MTDERFLAAADRLRARLDQQAIRIGSQPLRRQAKRTIRRWETETGGDVSLLADLWPVDEWVDATATAWTTIGRKQRPVWLDQLAVPADQRRDLADSLETRWTIDIVEPRRQLWATMWDRNALHAELEAADLLAEKASPQSRRRANPLVVRIRRAVSDVVARIVDRIAGTESLIATMSVQHHTIATIAPTVLKRWRTVGDDRVRDWHAEAEGQTQPVGEPYLVGPDLLSHPRDPNGTPANVINCRCFETYTLVR